MPQPTERDVSPWRDELFFCSPRQQVWHSSPGKDNVRTCKKWCFHLHQMLFFKSKEKKKEPIGVICCDGDRKPPVITFVLTLLSTELMLPSAQVTFPPRELMLASAVIAEMICSPTAILGSTKSTRFACRVYSSQEHTHRATSFRCHNGSQPRKVEPKAQKSFFLWIKDVQLCLILAPYCWFMINLNACAAMLGRPMVRPLAHCLRFWNAVPHSPEQLEPRDDKISGELQAHTGTAYLCDNNHG